MDSTQIEKYKIEIDSLTREINNLNEIVEHYNSHTFLIILGIALFIGLIIFVLILILKKQKNLLRNDIIKKLENFKDIISNDKTNRLLVPVSDGHEYLKLDKLVWIEADGRYSVFHFINKKTLIISKNLGEFEKILDKNKFIRIHNSYIVNLKYMDKVTKSDGGFVIMQDHSELPISKSKKDNLDNLLKNE